MKNPETLDEKNVQAVFQHAARLMAQGQSTHEIENDLKHCGLNHASAAAVVRKLSELSNKVDRESGQKNILFGALYCFGGIVLTVITFLTSGSAASYVVALGAVFFGAIQLSRGKDQARDLVGPGDSSSLMCDDRGSIASVSVRSSSAPLTLAAETALSKSTSVASAALIHVTTSHPAFSTMQVSCEPVIEIDGKASKGSWGSRVFLVSPGRHTLKAYHRWAFSNKAYASEVTVDVPEAAVVCLGWRTGGAIFSPGKWTQEGKELPLLLPTEDSATEQSRRCPSCGKTIKCSSEVCQHCGQATF